MRSSFSLRNAYGDHMVLQRGKPIRIAGTATPGSGVSGIFCGRIAKAVADAAGEWVLEFPPMEAGGPYELTVQGDCHVHSSIALHDILVGDVWFCSGQSNMSFPVWSEGEFWRLKDGEEVAAAANDNRLRLLQVPYGVDPDAPCTEAPGRPAWMPATTPDAIKPFSAVAYWFGKRLREALGDDVPIGLVNSSWGGALIEPWIPEEAFARAGRKGELSAVARARALYDERGSVPEDDRAKMAFKTLQDWINLKFLATDPAASAEALARWATADAGADAAWERGPLTRLASLPVPGVYWLRREFTLPESCAGRPAILAIGSVNDCDETFLDGAKIGETGIDTPQYWMAPRKYALTIPATPGGRHVLAVRIQDHYMSGWLRAPVTLVVEGIDTPFDLAGGEWARRVEFEADIDAIGPRPPVPGGETDPRMSYQTPTTLYNSMVHPFVPMNIRGVAWYQGCSNSGAPDDYLVLSRIWIDAWRRLWRDDKLPFLVTQLAAFCEHHPDTRLPDDFWRDDTPSSRPGYAPLREVQARLAEEDPLVGLACAIDIGDHSDIHPANKRDVGLRLAHEALRLSYGRADALPGPRLDTATREGDALRLRFRDVGAGLEAGAGIGPHLFAVAGADKKFAWADARLEADGTVVVRSADVPAPEFVRYAWSAFPPDVTLRRKGDGLPVFPFRTA